MSLTRKAPTAAKKKEKPQRQDLDQALAEREAELAETRRQQAALSEVLQIINDSPGDLVAAFDAITEIAVRLCDAAFGGLWAVDGNVARAVTVRNLPEPYREFLTREPAPLEQILGRTAGDRPFLQIEDLSATTAYRDRLPLTVATVELGGVKTYLGIPLREAQCIVGIINLMRTEVRPFSDKQIAVAQSFAVQAQIALKNARLFRETQEALERQTATANVLNVIASSPTDVRPVFEAIAASANMLIGGFSTAVLRFIGETIHLAAFTPTNPTADEALRTSFPQALAEFQPFVLVRGGETIQFSDTEADSVPSLNRELARLRGYRSMLIAPLMSNDAAIGMISVTRKDPGAFAPHHVQLLKTFADQAVIAINNVGLFNETQEALKQQTATADILKVIASSPADVEPVLEAVADRARNLLDCWSALVVRFDGEQAHFGAARGALPDTEKFVRQQYPSRPEPESTLGRCLLERAPISHPNLQAAVSPTLREYARARGFRAVMSVPILQDGRPIGAIIVTRQKAGDFAPRENALLQTFAAQAAIAIENTRLFNETKEALAQQTATADVLKVITRSAFDLQVVFRVLVENAVRLCGAQTGMIFQRNGDLMHLAAADGPTQAFIEYVRDNPIPATRRAATGRALLEGRTVQILDVEADPDYGYGGQSLERYRTIVAVPLVRNDAPIGVFTLWRHHVEAFTPRQLALVETFADQAVVAIENARLFEEVEARTHDLKEALQQQTATADVLKVISASAFDLDKVFTTLIERAARLCGANRGTIFLRQGDVLLPSALYGLPEGTRQALIANPLRVDDTSAGGRAVLTKSVCNVTDVMTDPLYRRQDVAAVAQYRSIIGVPLIQDGQAIGVFSLPRMEPGGFTPRQIETLKTFADQAVIAIENSRLFNEVQAKTRDLEESLQQQTATADVLKVISRSAFDLQAVLETLVTSAATLCIGDGGAIWLRRGELFECRATHGFSPERRELLQANPRRLDDKSLVPRVARSGRIEHIPDRLLEPEYSFPGMPQFPHRTLLGVPLLRDGKVEGAFTLTREQQNPFTAREIEILQTFADQAVIAIENTRLFDEVQARTRDLEESLQQQTATADVLKVISRSAFDLQTVFESLISTAMRLCSAKQGVIFRRQGDIYRYAASHMLVHPTYRAHEQRAEIKAGRGTLIGRVALENRPVQISDAWTDPEYAEKDEVRLGNVRAMLGVPLMRNGEPIGAFALGRGEPVPFTERQVELVATFADQAVIAIENVRLFDEVQARTRDLEESLQQQTATADVLKVISRSAFDLQAVLDTLVRSAAELSESSSGIIYLQYDNAFHIKAHFGMRAEFVRYLEENPQKPGRGSVGGRVLLTGALQNIPDAQVDEEYDPVLKSNPATRALLGVPLLRDGKIVGAIFLARARPVAFSQRQIELVQTFADQAVIAIENVRLFDEVQARTRDLSEALQQQTATADVLKVISRSAFDLQTVLDTLVASAARLIGASNGLIYLQVGDIFEVNAATRDWNPETFRLLKETPHRPGRQTVGARVLLTGEVQNIADMQADPDYDPAIRSLSASRALLGVPLKRGDAIIGAFVLARRDAGAFSQREIELVQTFADQAVIAIENARLFEEVQARTRDLAEALQQQTATADVLKAISRTAFDLDTVLETLISTAVRLCDSNGGEIFRRYGDVYRYAASLMDLGPAYLEHEQKAEIKAGRGTLIGRVAAENRTVEIADAWNDPEYSEKEEVRVAGVRAMLGVPLMRDGELIGAFALGRTTPVPFTQRQVELVTTFADQAVIAIENARLFDEVQARTRELEESLQQQTATADVLKVISRSAFDLQAVLTTLAESARELCGASFVTLFMRDGSEMRLRAESGCTPEIVAFLQAHPIRAGRETFTGRVMLSGEAVHLPDVLADPEYEFGDAPRIGNYRALLGVPLLRNSQVEGVFALARPEPAPFTVRQIEMVRAFADQAVIAIENARLFDEVQARTRELAASLDDLRKAQDRLIQSEKLASLGQLTAGIAHEIKNPLNFINNYSALSRELVDELAEAIKGGRVNEAAQGEAGELIGTIGGNLDKIVQHGKRADSIVKNMLLHSREGSGERSTTNVNAMVEEALNLAYHGARAEKPGFNVTIVKSLEPKAGAAEVYAQEMTRVLLNLISNGFYATSKRKQSAGEDAYEPTISASTRDLGPKVEIAIRDNGTGIPDEVKAKMFNPFFTTKPAGEGTGLGLSLSHDIVVKQHGGAIEVSTEPGAFTQFTIVLPRGAAGT